MDTIRKSYVAERPEILEDERAVVAYVTTDSLDRDGEVVLPAGLQLENFRKNPIVMWAHKYDLAPIGKCLDIKADARGLIAKTQFSKTERGEEIWQLYKDGFLKGFSIGMLPDRSGYSAPTAKELSTRPDWKGAKSIIRKAEVVEYSAVPIPCNRDALTRAIASKALNLSPDVVQSLSLDAPAVPLKVLMTEKELGKAVRQEIEAMDGKTLVAALDLGGLVRAAVDKARGRV